MMAFAQDDGIEMDGGQCNVRLFDNRFEQSMTGISIAPNKKGPSYIFNNLVYNLGNIYNRGTSGSKAGGGTTHSTGIQHFFNNTIISHQSPYDAVGYGNDANRSAYKVHTRNNIFMVSNLPAGLEDFFSYEPAVYDQYPMPQSSFDYDMIANSGVGSGQGIVTLAAGNEAHGVFKFPTFTSLANGVFTLNNATNPAVDKGTIIPNFSKSYSGTKPDLGAFEYGNSSLSPQRPVDMFANKYYINTSPDTTVTITVTMGAIGSGRHFSIRKSEDMSWLTVTSSPAAGAISPNSIITITCTATEMANSIQKGMLLVRLDNGFSIPITVGFSGTGTQLGPDRTRLSNLTTDKGILVPAFSPQVNHYSLTVANNVDEVKLTPTVTMPNATIKVNGTATPSGGVKGLDLTAGQYVYATVRVTATADSTVHSQKTVKDYFITIYRAAAGETLSFALPDTTNRITNNQEQPEAREVILFPNPASKQATVRFSPGIYHTLQLISFEGRICNTFNIGVAKNSFFFPLTGLPSGMYQVKLIGNRTAVTKKLLKL